ncbi:MAG TPA: hypothetical protein VF163_05645 [Micromonosporaceae bacterium]
MIGLTSARRRIAGAAAIAGALLGLGLLGGGTPAAANDVATMTLSGWDFEPSDYPQCRISTTAQTIRGMAGRIKANSPVSYLADGNAADEDAPLYRVPTAAERTDFRAGLNALIDDNSSVATTRLTAAGFAVCSGEIDSTSPDPNVGFNMVLVYSPAGLNASTSLGAPMLVLWGARGQPDYTVLSGPHLTSEVNVFDQVLSALDRKQYVRGAILSGTDRCNRLALAPAQFQGDTTECGGDYRISDMAHNTGTIFQDMHDVLRGQYPQLYNVQLHGMSQAGISVSRGTDPDGADGTGTHPDDPVTVAHAYAEVQLKKELEIGGVNSTEQPHYDALSSCTAYVHSMTGVSALTRDLHCGTFNAQLARERDLNAQDRFIHIEQSRYIRDYHPVDYLIKVAYGLFSKT